MRHESRGADRIGAHRTGNRCHRETGMPVGEGGQGEDRPLPRTRTGAAREGEALHVRAVGAGEARRPADTGDRVDDESDHGATDSAGKYFR